MSFRAVSGRFGTSTAAVVLFSLPLACVNRGQHAPELDDASGLHVDVDAHADLRGAGGWRADGGGTTVDAGAGGGGDSGATPDARSDLNGAAGTMGGGAGAGGAGGPGGAAGSSGVGGNLGTGGVTGSGGRGAGGSGAGGSGVDGGAADLGAICGARFNFENGSLYGAFVNNGFQTAFSNLRQGSDAACGSGSLRVDVNLSPSSAKGELILPLGTTQSLAGRTVSLSVKMTPRESPNAYVIVFAVPSYTFITAFSPIPANWDRNRVTLAANAGATASTGISVQVIGRGDTYAGTLLVDEVDVR